MAFDRRHREILRMALNNLPRGNEITDVIRDGLKGGITLAGCGDCHHSREQFCDRCHEAASVSLEKAPPRVAARAIAQTLFSSRKVS